LDLAQHETRQKLWTVAAVNRMAASNQITLTANLNSVSGVASGDFIVPEGDLVTPGTYLCMAGLQDWIPASAPGATAFFGQDRTADTTRLGGQRQAFDTSIKQTILEAAMTVRSRRRKTRCLFPLLR
jgi:hypothetical protein